MTMAQSFFQRVAVLGTGLIGGSFALAVRLQGARVTGWDVPEVLARAKQAGAIDEAAGDVATAVSGADLVYVSLPIGAAMDVLKTVAAHAPSEALVTDACSIKQMICEAASKQFAKGPRFLGGHPMAGREEGGIAQASAELFRGAKYALIGSAGDTDTRIQKFAGLVRAMGAEPVWMDAETHDWAVSIVSHLPQLVAVALASVVSDETDEAGLPLDLAGPGLGDTLRLAGSPYEMWRDICHTNDENISRALDRLIARLEHLRSNLKTRELEREFAAANEVYKTLRGMK